MTLQIINKLILQILIIFLFILSLLSKSLIAQPSGTWVDYRTGTNPEANGVDISLKIPGNYTVSPAKKPGVLIEFSRVNEEKNYLYYLSISIISFPNNFVDSTLLTTNKKWIDSNISAFWEQFVKGLNGFQSYKNFYYKDQPATDVIINQEQKDPYIAYRIIDVRNVIYKNHMIALQCGDISADKSAIALHEITKNNVCKYFFDSLIFN
jgi:hypothetical protein